MILKMCSAASALSVWTPHGESLSAPFFRCCSLKITSSVNSSSGRSGALVVYASNDDINVVGPFPDEVKKELDLVPSVPNRSLARQRFSQECKLALNDQINRDYKVSYMYDALYAYFDRDYVGLEGFAKFFNDLSLETRQQAKKLIQYQNKRGGRVELRRIVMPLTDFHHPDMGDGLYAMEFALSMERVTNDRLLDLHKVASKNNDPQMADFIEGDFLTRQVDIVKKISEYVAQLRRIGKGHGVWHFDQMLLQDEVVVA
ncbi:hypothetical protein Scep_011238 [Stephania cephalantha]|uniref:Ferritin n=1 Tax=Stephania cephalantha TaxID=152367 RepID=A0AAP0P832_9MAGN